MASCDVTFNLSDISFARRFVGSFEISNLMAKHFLPYVLMFGLLFNLTFLFVVIRLKRMRTIINLYLSLQATADCLYLLIQTGPTMWRVLNMHKANPHYCGNWYNLATHWDSVFDSQFGCFFQTFATSYCYYVSIGFV